MDDADMGGRKPFGEAGVGKLVHQEADRAAMHAIDRLAGIHEPMQGRQHEAVAAERDDDVGGLRPGVTVAADKPAAGLLRRRHTAGDEGDALETGCGPALCHNGVGGCSRIGFKTAAARRHGRSIWNARGSSIRPIHPLSRRRLPAAPWSSAGYALASTSFPAWSRCTGGRARSTVATRW